MSVILPIGTPRTPTSLPTNSPAESGKYAVTVIVSRSGLLGHAAGQRRATSRPRPAGDTEAAAHGQSPSPAEHVVRRHRRLQGVEVDEPAAAGGVRDVADGRRHQLQHPLQRLVLRVQGVEGEVEVDQRRPQVVLGLGDDRGQRPRQRRGLHQQSVDGLASRRDLADHEVGLLHQADDVAAAARELVGHARARPAAARPSGSERVDTTSDSRATPSSAGPMSSPEAARVSLVAVSAFASCTASSSSRRVGADLDHVLEVVGHHGPLERDRAVRQRPGPLGVDLQVVGAEQGGHLHRGGGLRAQLDVLVEHEADLDVGVHQVVRRSPRRP